MPCLERQEGRRPRQSVLALVDEHPAGGFGVSSLAAHKQRTGQPTISAATHCDERKLTDDMLTTIVARSLLTDVEDSRCG